MLLLLMRRYNCVATGVYRDDASINLGIPVLALATYFLLNKSQAMHTYLLVMVKA